MDFSQLSSKNNRSNGYRETIYE